MEDAYYFNHSLQSFRENTFKKALNRNHIKFPYNLIIELSKAGFYFRNDSDSFKKLENIVKSLNKNYHYFHFVWHVQCFQCNLQIDVQSLLNFDNPSVDIIEYHRTKSPDCLFIKNYKPFRSRIFFHLKKI